MASRAVQPQAPSSSSAVPLQAQVDMNGEQIIKEMNILTYLTNSVSISSTSPSTLVRYFGSGPSCPSCDVCLCLPSLKCCSCASCLYLTSTHIHIVRKTCADLITCQKQISLIDITEIKAVDYVTNAGWCGFGTQINTSPSCTIMMELQPDGAKQFFPICCSYCNLPTVLTIYCSEDPTEFVTAVKQCMVTMPRE